MTIIISTFYAGFDCYVVKAENGDELYRTFRASDIAERFNVAANLICDHFRKHDEPLIIHTDGYNYRGYIIEYIAHRGDYRVYAPSAPAQTVAYEDSIASALSNIDEQGIY